MDTRLLKLAHHDSLGVRHWIIPGFQNSATLTPSRHTEKGWGPSFRWPDRDHRGEHTKAVDLDRHLVLARAAAHDLIWHATHDETELE